MPQEVTSLAFECLYKHSHNMYYIFLRCTGTLLVSPEERISYKVFNKSIPDELSVGFKTPYEQVRMARFYTVPIPHVPRVHIMNKWATFAY